MSTSVKPQDFIQAPIDAYNFDFISLPTYSTDPLTDYPSYATFMACNSKEDILTPSQMLKTNVDASKFTTSQPDEINGLLMYVQHN